MHGVRDNSMLLSALGRPRATFDRRPLYPNLFSQAAALPDSFIRNHPFLDGNKRTAITVTALFLQKNGFQLVVTGDTLVRFALACAQSQVDLEDIAIWLEKFSEPF